MKIMNITNVDRFFKVIDQCEGKVELITENGDRYNLKSKLNQYVALAKVFFGGNIPKVELVAHNPADTQRLIQYMIQR